MEKLVVSANVARQMLSTSPNTMQMLINTGEVKAFKEGRSWKVSVESLKEYVTKRVREDMERRGL